jgi:hypothetical protein
MKTFNEPILKKYIHRFDLLLHALNAKPYKMPFVHPIWAASEINNLMHGL